MKTPELRRRIRAWFKSLREHAGRDVQADESLEITAGELAAFVAEILQGAEKTTAGDVEVAARELATALSELFGLIETGELVRDVRDDHKPGWHHRAARLVMVLKRCVDAIDAARARGWVSGG